MFAILAISLACRVECFSNPPLLSVSFPHVSLRNGVGRGRSTGGPLICMAGTGMYEKIEAKLSQVPFSLSLHYECFSLSAL